MMALQKVYLSNSTVNSGTQVDIKATEITFKHANNLRSPSKAGFFTTSDTIGEVDFMGWNNPTLTIQGLFDEKSASSNTATISLMKSFVKDTNSSTYFKDNLIFTSSQQVQLGALTLNRNAADNVSETGSDTYKGTLINYTLTAVLTE